jgi:DNA-binding IclR family transcriptional regulator
MTPAEETEFIALWNQGLEIAVMAERLGIPRGMVQSQAHRLQRCGLIQPQPKGRAYPRQKVLARQDGSPATPAMTFVAVPEIQELLSLVKGLHARVGALEQTRVPTALPAPPPRPQ